MSNREFLGRVVAAVDVALAAHNESLDLEKGNSPQVDVWQLLASVRAFCRFHSINFDSLVEDSREEDEQC